MNSPAFLARFPVRTGTLLTKAARQLARCVPKSLRALILLAATIVFFPLIVGFIVLASVTEDLPGVRQLLGSSQSPLRDSDSVSPFHEIPTHQ